MKKKKLTRKEALKRFYFYGALIKECKIKYYYTEYGVSPLPDASYDKLEERYKSLASKLKLEPYETNQVGCNLERPSVKLAINGKFPIIKKYLEKKQKRKRALEK